MARKKLANQTKDEKMFEMACKMAGRNITSQDSRFFMRLTHLVEKNANFQVREVAELAVDCYEINLEDDN